MRIIITGGTGLMGRALVESLATDRHDVIVVSRSPEKAILPAGVRAERWDGRTASGWWGALADGADAIVNLAGESIGGENIVALMANRWTPERKQLIRSSRVNVGMAVKQVCPEAVRVAIALMQCVPLDRQLASGDSDPLAQQRGFAKASRSQDEGACAQSFVKSFNQARARDQVGSGLRNRQLGGQQRIRFWVTARR